MKTKTLLMLALFAVPAVCPGQEGNPFVQKKTPEPVVLAEAGGRFVGVIEHVVVPSGKIEAWILEHGVPADATELRAEVQRWVADGTAKVDCTAVTTGVTGRSSSNERVLEQIYPTEYLPGGSGVWPLPTAFETQNLGYETSLSAESSGETVRFLVEADLSLMAGSTAWNALMEGTRHPDDVFFPTIQAFTLKQEEPTDPSELADPFADSRRRVKPRNDHRPSFEGGRVRLLGRFQQQAPEGVWSVARLIFARGEAEDVFSPEVTLGDEYSVSIRTIRVPNHEFSQWVQEQAPLEIPSGAWEFSLASLSVGSGSIVDAADCRGTTSKRNTIDNITELIYPTEWEPMNQTTFLERWEEAESRIREGKRVEGIATRIKHKIDSLPGLAGMSLAASFETRHTGITYKINVLPDEQGFVVEHSLVRVREVGRSVFRRVEHEGEWVPDITIPLFTSDRFQTSNRLRPGEWTLISSGVEFDETGKTDPDHCLLMFVKVE